MNRALLVWTVWLTAAPVPFTLPRITDSRLDVHLAGPVEAAVADIVEFAYRGALFAAIGACAWLSVRGPQLNFGRRLGVLLSGLVLGVGLAWFRLGLVPSLWLLIAAGLLAAWGWGLGSALGRGRRAVLMWVMGSGFVAAGALAGAVVLATDSAPAVADSRGITDEDRRHLRHLLKTAGTSQSGDYLLELSAEDLNLVADSWVNARHAGLRPEFELTGSRVRTCVTVPCRVPGLGLRFLNLAVDSHPQVDLGRLEPGLTRLAVGGLILPRSLREWASTVGADIVHADPDAGRVLHSIDSLQVSDGVMIVSGHAEESLSVAWGSEDEEPEPASELALRVTAYLEQIGPAYDDFVTDGDARFVAVVQRAFTLAALRSADGGNAVAENQAALAALGIALGDARVRHLAGFEPGRSYPRIKTQVGGRTTILRRNDLCRHFVVSAALTVLAGKSVSAAAGLLKEQLDAADGGSGFSFADLAADKAGVMFAERAIASEDAARAFQLRIAAEWQVDDLMPSIVGLPEGLSDEEVQELGGAGGKQFRAQVEEIDRRLKNCRLLGDERSPK
jgi:hypothetical protein